VFDSLGSIIGTLTFTNPFVDVVGALGSGIALSPPTGTTDKTGYILLSNIDADFEPLDFKWRLYGEGSFTYYASLTISAVPTLLPRLGGKAIYDAHLDIT
jgi:hypothetical protein